MPHRFLKEGFKTIYPLSLKIVGDTFYIDVFRLIRRLMFKALIVKVD